MGLWARLGVALLVIGPGGCARDNPAFQTANDAAGDGTAGDGTAGDGTTSFTSKSDGDSGDSGGSAGIDSGGSTMGIDPNEPTVGDTGTSGRMDTSTTVDGMGLTDSDTDTTAGFRCDDGDACDVDADDTCSPGERCQPFGIGGNAGFDVAVCRPLAGNVGTPGDECSFSVCDGDDCDIGSVCVVGADGVTGVCQPMCNLAAGQLCGNPDEACVPASTIQLCRPLCDPLLQDCDNNSGCYVVADDAVCIPDTSGGVGLEFDECPGDYTQTCAIGMACISGLNGCAGPNCCTSYCEVGQSDCGMDYDCVALVLGPPHDSLGFCEFNG